MFYPQETGPNFNALTLQIFDKEIAQDFKNNQIHEFNQMFWIFNFFATVNLIQEILSHITGTSDFFFLVNAIFQSTMFGLVWPLTNRRSKLLATFIVFPYGLYYYIMDGLAFARPPG